MAFLQPTARLVRAAAAERAELERHRAKLAAEARQLRAALMRIEHGLAEIDERCGLLERLAPAVETRQPEQQAGGLLRGPAIRETAVTVLIEQGRESIHYRKWFDLLAQQGHAIAGKDPIAVFLTQISRSPAMRKGLRAGVYELDREAPARLQHTLDGLHKELRDLATTGTADLAAVRSRRRQLTTAISQAERALEEAARLLGATPGLAASHH